MFISKKIKYLIIAVIVVLMAFVIINNIRNVNTLNNETNENEDVIKLVEEFGTTLKNVSLLAPRDVIVNSIEDNYSPYITNELLQKWRNDPRSAPGRMLSSPWPERIEITEVERISDNEYSVKGKIIEVTSVELKSGGAAASRLVELTVRKMDNKWLIDNISIGNYE